MPNLERSGTIIDVRAGRLLRGTVVVRDGRIADIVEADVPERQLILPGFIDAHVHIESSMLTPSAFASVAVTHGTVATVSDPHEIANVCGVDGVRWMLESAATAPMKVCFGAPSCVPATVFETAGAAITAKDIEELLRDPRIGYLSEMMNYPGVIHRDASVWEKIRVAHASGKPIDGHAPGVRGEEARAYAAAGIRTDHECTTLEEALEKIGLGMKILIREGSAAKNFDALHPLISSHPGMVMLCSDDKHPDALLRGHMNELVIRAIRCGHAWPDVLRAACINPVEHYSLPVGTLRVGDAADFIVMDSFESSTVQETFIDGDCVARSGRATFTPVAMPPINTWYDRRIDGRDLEVPASSSAIRVIDVADGQLLTKESQVQARVVEGTVRIDADRDILKLVVVNRYGPAAPAVAFVRNFGLRAGALASSVAHDSHNVIAVGTSDALLARAVNAVFETRGGCAWVSDTESSVLPLPVAGLMSDGQPRTVARAYEELDGMVKRAGCVLTSPWMTLSFLALLVIPALKLSDRGLFDGRTFRFTEVCVRDAETSAAGAEDAAT
ncbi:MAG: adenine deaminase [Candidatus Kapaibacterium sp.]